MAALTQPAKHKGVVANSAALPSTGQVAGDVYVATDTGHAWQYQGAAFVDIGQGIIVGAYSWVAGKGLHLPGAGMLTFPIPLYRGS
jgi:hypothetical protein